MYAAVLFLHSWARWLVLVLALLAVVRAIAGAAGRRPWTPADERVGALFVRTLDVQFLLGLLLYLGLSPITRAAFSDFGGAMGVAVTRFWAVEHIFGMVIAVTLAHIGHKRVQRIQDAARKHRVTAIFIGLSLLIMLASIPWPGSPAARPLFRW